MHVKLHLSPFAVKLSSLVVAVALLLAPKLLKVCDRWIAPWFGAQERLDHLVLEIANPLEGRLHFEVVLPRDVLGKLVRVSLQILQIVHQFPLTVKLEGIDVRSSQSHFVIAEIWDVTAFSI